MRRLYHIVKQRRFLPGDMPVSEFDGSLPFLPPAIELGPPTKQQCRLFQLPVEIYTQILASAFTGHFVHINLLPVPVRDLERERYKCYDNRSDEMKKRQKTWSRNRLAEAKIMAWRGVVCERTVLDEGSEVLAKHVDFCLHGEGRCLQHPRSTYEPEYRTLEALNFLLSCKQGYLDLASMLYSTNTFILNTHRLVHAVVAQSVPGAPRIISPMIHHLTSLELFVSFRLFQHHSITQENPTAEELSERQRFRNFIDLFPKAFPDLARLHIHFDNGIFYGFAGIGILHKLDDLKTEFLEPLRLLAGKLPRLQYFSAAMEYDVFIKLMIADCGISRDEHTMMLARDGLHGARAWYPSDASEQERGRPAQGFWAMKGSKRDLRGAEERRMLHEDICCPGCFRGCTD